MLTLKLKNLGPISRAEMCIKPLTILIGPNSAGKSYVTQLLYSFLTSVTELSPYYSSVSDLSTKKYSYVVDNLMSEEIREKLYNGTIIELKNEKVVSIINNLLQNSKLELEEGIARIFGTKTLRSLVKENSKTADFDFILGKLGILSFKLNNKLSLHRSLELLNKNKILLIPSEKYSNIKVKWTTNSCEIYINYEAFSSKRSLRRIEYELISSIMSSVMDFQKIFYLPPGRSAIINSLDAAASNLIVSGSLTGQFLSQFIAVDSSEKSEMWASVSAFEKNMFKGFVTIEQAPVIPKVVYHFGKMELPIRRASSSISELTPLFLYAKHSLKKGDLIIIEEPEAHLHPENQANIAKFIALLLKNGINIIITTHSDYFLTRLNNLISKKEIDANSISAYLFKLDNSSNGYKTTPIYKNGKISSVNFLQIDYVLYKEKLMSQHK